MFLVGCDGFLKLGHQPGSVAGVLCVGGLGTIRKRANETPDNGVVNIRRGALNDLLGGGQTVSEASGHGVLCWFRRLDGRLPQRALAAARAWVLVRALALPVPAAPPLAPMLARYFVTGFTGMTTSEPCASGLRNNLFWRLFHADDLLTAADIVEVVAAPAFDDAGLIEDDGSEIVVGGAIHSAGHRGAVEPDAAPRVTL